jgi:formyltetrahydrofolate deformylase
MEPFILLIACSDRKGIIHAVTGVLLKYDFNIISNAEFVEREIGTFFMRTEFSGNIDTESLKSEIAQLLPENAFLQLTKKRKKNIVLLATKESHCLGDLLLRNYSNELDANISAVISNYPVLGDLCAKFGIQFEFISHEGKSRLEHEVEISKTLDKYMPEYLVLAKYMRILSSEFTAKYPNRIINIHHSFLPAFIGARPYEQAYQRGVKIIGATAHFVNEDLDEGPIIAQNVIPVAHSYSATDMMLNGKDVEKIVLAKALKLVLEERVFVSGNKTIIFD